MAWLAGYAYRKPLVLTGGASGAQNDFQLDITIAHVAAKMQADFDDIRFTQNNGTTLIDAWLESKVDSTSAETWAKFPTTPANTVEQTYYMYYGKVVVSDWDGAATFLQYHGGTTSNYQDSEIIGPNNIVYENRVKATGTLASAYLLTGIGANVPFGDEGGDQLRAIQHNPSGNTYYASWNNGNQTYFNNAPAIIDGSYHRYVITFDGSTATYYRDDVNKGTNTTNLPNEAMGLRFSVKAGAAEQEWSFARKYATNPPTYAFGAEESAPTGAAPTSIFIGPFGGPLGGPIQ
jgi:hypothetical protein